MKTTRIAALAAAGLFAALAGSAAATAGTVELRANQATSIDLKDRTAVIHVATVDGAFAVVTTAANNDGSRPLRTVHKLADGQGAALQLAADTRVDVARKGDRLAVTHVTQVAQR